MMPRLPTFIFVDDSSIQKGKAPNVVRSEMEVGVQKTRRKQSASMYNVNFAVSICDDKEQNFWTWFQDEISDGAFWFLMKDPISGVEKRFRFVNYEIVWKKDGDVLTSNFQLESY